MVKVHVILLHIDHMLNVLSVGLVLDEVYIIIYYYYYNY
jgi:hypothetical protein